jgi:hypothetical protein
VVPGTNQAISRRQFVATSLAAGSFAVLAARAGAPPTPGVGQATEAFRGKAAIASAEGDDLRQATSDLLLDWARLLAPHIGPNGSLDLDLRDFPGAQGPSYYNQFGHYSFLLLSEGIVPGAGDAERAVYRRHALANLGYVLGITDAEFHTPHFSRGRDWGRHVGEWLNYYLLCSLAIMEKHAVGSPTLRDRIAAAVIGATTILYTGFKRRFAATPAEFPGNHAVWHGLLFFRAGRHFNRPEWVGFARDFFARCVVPFQQPAGYWPEGHGLVVNYSMVTAEAVSLYAEFSGDEAAQACIGRALGLATFFNLPDGSSAVVVDNRMRYDPRPFLALPPGFIRSAEGRGLLRERLRAARGSFARTGVSDNGAQVFAFFGSLAELAFDPRMTRGGCEPTLPARLPAARIESDGWVGMVGWQLTPESPSRFILDSQNFIELWHRDAGYLIGGGNSKSMPRFSTLRRIDRGRAYIADKAGGVQTGPGEATATYTFGPDEVRLSLALRDGRCEFSARLVRGESGATYEAGLILLLQSGDVLQTAGGRETIEPATLVNLGGARLRDGFTWRGRSWRVPPGAVLEYPVVPHNPYTQHGLPAPTAYVGRLSFPVSAEEGVVIIA